MCSQDQVLPFPLPSKVVWHRGGFGQGRARPLRAPKGSLDWSHRDADNLRGGNGRGSKGGTFLTRTKGDIIKVARHTMGRMKRCALTLLLAVGLWGQTENLCCGRTR